MTASPMANASFSRRWLPPLTFALVGLVFAALFCGTALLDLQRLETLLLTALQTRGLATVTTLEKAVQDKLYHFQTGSEGAAGPFAAGYPGNEEEMALREALAQSLLDLARHLDLLAQNGTLRPEVVAELAQTEQLAGIQVLSAAGQVSLQVGEGLAAAAQVLAPLLQGQDEVCLHLAEGTTAPTARSFLALRRAAGGAVVLILDAASLTFWQWRAAVQAALRHLPVNEDFAYFRLTTATDQLLVQIGQLPEQPLAPCRLLQAPSPGRQLQASFCSLTGGNRILELVLPFQVGPLNLGTARLGLQTRETDTLLAENRRHIFLWTASMLSLGLLAMVLIYRFQHRYLTRLQTMQDRLRQAERLSSLGKLAAGMAHEIRNPLNAIGIAVQRLHREFSPEVARPPAFSRLTQTIRQEIDRLNQLIEEFLNLARPGRLQLETLAITGLLADLQTLVQAEAAARGIRLIIEVAENCPPITLDRQKIQQALINLIKNAFEAISGPGEIHLRAAPTGTDYLCLILTDSGHGLTQEELAQIFDPYYTTKERGLGLGLTLAYEIVKAHGGQLTVASQPGRGTTFTLLLPRSG